MSGIKKLLMYVCAFTRLNLKKHSLPRLKTTGRNATRNRIQYLHLTLPAVIMVWKGTRLSLSVKVKAIQKALLLLVAAALPKMAAKEQDQPSTSAKINLLTITNLTCNLITKVRFTKYATTSPQQQT